MTTGRSKNETSIWRAPELGAELLRGRFADFSFDLHSHDRACFALLTWGAIRIRMRGGEFVARRGDLYAIDADQPHAGSPIDDQGWSQRTLYVDMAYLRSLIGDEQGGFSRQDGAARLAGPIIRDAELSSMLYGVHRCSQERGPALYREERYLAFVSRLFERHAVGGPAPLLVGREDRAVRLAREFLDAHLDSDVSLEAIAGAAGLPPFRLFRGFQRATGMTPHGYQRQARIRSATDLIRRGQTLAEVAAAAGFADQAHLTRCFRRAMDITPGSFRAAVA